MFKRNRKATVIVILSAIIFVGNISFTNHLQPRFKNLKVLSANIADEQLDDVMDGFKASLGVKCNFCHAPSKTQQGKMDMASDDNARKDITREMMRMTNEMNQKYIANIPHTDTAKIQMVPNFIL